MLSPRYTTRYEDLLQVKWGRFIPIFTFLM
ncbi:hypothetical protein [Salmonella enterica]|nr:hypothetical protein [Salmonella enterica]